MSIGNEYFSKNIFSSSEKITQEPALNKNPENAAGSATQLNKTYSALKKKLHTMLLSELDTAKFKKTYDSGNNELLKQQITELLDDLLKQEAVPMGVNDKKKLLDELLDDVFGFGPIEPLLKDNTVNDILVNGPNQVYVERKGVLEKTNVTFDNEEQLMRVIRRITAKVGRRVDESSPMVDARLPDGSRVNAIIKPLAIDGASLSIRKFSEKKFVLDDLVKISSITEGMCELLKLCVICRLNIIISGGTGSGKTTFLNALSKNIPAKERVVTIEDAAELQLQRDHVVRLETRPMNLEGKGEVSQRDLVKNALRMRPERIILGEIRGGEALDLLQAMNTGHDGSMGTLHANTSRDAFSRMETMCLMAGYDLPQRAIREQISSAVNLVVQLNRFPDGSRKVTQISEVTGMENGVITTQDVFSYEQQGMNEQGKVKGIFKPSGIRPVFSKRIESMGYKIPQGIFSHF